MGISFSRRSFMKATVLGGAALTPLGIFFGSSARATIPTGDYLRDFSDEQYWFSKLRTDLNTDLANKPLYESDKGQFSFRLGQAGGFAIGYFSTLGFLSRYRMDKPDDFHDLLIN